MKKKILGLCMVACLGVTVAGCAADLDDVEKQVTKMEKVIEEGKIFEKDWAVTVTMTYGDETSEMVMKRDGDNFYMLEDDSEQWLIKDGDEYVAYYKSGDEKMTADIPEEMLEGTLSQFNLKGMYEMFAESLKDLDEECAEDGVTCEFEKNLFGKLTITMTEGEGEAAVTSTMVLKGGKILSTSTTSEGMEMSYEVEYKNQTVKAPEDKDQYTKADF